MNLSRESEREREREQREIRASGGSAVFIPEESADRIEEVQRSRWRR
jgi:hypothetical protein